MTRIVKVSRGYAGAMKSVRVVTAWVLALLVGGAGCGGPKRLEPKLDEGVVDHAYRIGLQYLKQGKPDLALAEFEKVVAAEPKNSLYWNVLGLACLGTADYARAGQAFGKVTELNPYFTDAHNNLGIVYSETGDYDRALAEFEKVLADKLYPTPEVARFNIGRIYLLRGDASSALPYLQQANVARPTDADWLLELGCAYEKLGRYTEANVAFLRALEVNPVQIEALYHLGTSNFMLKNYKKARDYFNRVVALAPGTELGSKSEEYLKSLG